MAKASLADTPQRQAFVNQSDDQRKPTKVVRTFHIEHDLHRKLKQKAFDEDRSMSQIVNQLLRDHLDS